MASNSYIDFELKNPAFFQELKRIGVYFSEDGRDCKLSTGQLLHT